MALSGREVLLILRARDEASRTLSRVSRNMSRLDRDAITASSRMAQEQGQYLTHLRRSVHDVEGAYRQATLQAQYLRNEGRISAKQYRTMMFDARSMRIEQMEGLRRERERVEDLLRDNRRRIAAIHDEASAVRELGHRRMAAGSAAVSVGAGITATGLVAGIAMKNAIQASMAYEDQARLTLSQIDSTKISLQDILDLGKEVGREVPVAFEQIQPALYDIFSSIDVGLRGARTLIKQFSKDAVAGGTDLEVATRANLQIMNAYKVGVEDAAEVSDFMFRLVQKGVGTYQDFATSIGRAIPSARRAGQSYETLGAMMAFLTRNGLSAAMAATSSARALDAISHPKTVERLEAMGVNVKNMRGEFLPLPKILDQMNDVFGDMTAPQRAKALQELFKSSGGTIQARRFFDNYFKNAKEFNKRSREMQKSAGRAGKAFRVMQETPRAKFQALINEFKVASIELGNALLPVVLDVVEALTDMFEWFNNLDPGVKKTVGIILGIIAVLTTLIGVITVVAGAGLILAGAITAMGGMAVVAPIVLGIVAGLAALAGIIAVVVANWDDIKPEIDKALEAARGFVAWFMDVFGPMIEGAWNGIKEGVKRFVSEAVKAWGNFKEAFVTEGMKDRLETLRRKFEDLKPTFEAIGKWLEKYLPVAFEALGRAVATAGTIWGQVIGGMFEVFLIWAETIFNVLGEIGDSFIKVNRAIQKSIKGDFIGAIKDMAGAAKNGVDIAGDIISAGRQTFEVAGKRLMEGAITGLNSMVPNAEGAARAAGHRMSNAFRHANKIASPSRVWMQLGKDLMDGLIEGMKGRHDRLDAIMDAINDSTDLRKKGMKKKVAAMKDRIREATADELKRLNKLSERYKDISARLEKAQDRLDSLKAAAASYREGVLSSVRSFGNLGNLGTFTDVFGNELAPTVSGIRQRLAEKLNTIRQWAANIRKMKKMGFSAALINQIIQMGPEEGAAYAAALVSATPSEVRSMNSLVSAIEGQAQQVAQFSTDMMYKAGIDAATGLVNGLKNKKEAVRQAAKELAQLIVKEVKKILGIKSPSRVALSQGANFGMALARGIRGQVTDVRRASRELAKASYMDFDRTSTFSTFNEPPKPPGFPPVVPGNGRPPADGSGTHVEQTFYITTQEIDPRKHAADLGFELAGRYR